MTCSRKNEETYLCYGCLYPVLDKETNKQTSRRCYQISVRSGTQSRKIQAVEVETLVTEDHKQIRTFGWCTLYQENSKSRVTSQRTQQWFLALTQLAYHLRIKGEGRGAKKGGVELFSLRKERAYLRWEGLYSRGFMVY